MPLPDGQKTPAGHLDPLEPTKPTEPEVLVFPYLSIDPARHVKPVSHWPVQAAVVRPVVLPYVPAGQSEQDVESPPSE